MGSYTELVLKAGIIDLPPKEMEVIEFMFNRNMGLPGSDKFAPKQLPKHPFFETPRWDAIGVSGSFYHHPHAFSSYQKGRLFTRCDLKNYDHEIELFLDWISPYICERDKPHCIGWICVEQDDPMLIYLENKKWRFEHDVIGN